MSVCDDLGHRPMIGERPTFAGSHISSGLRLFAVASVGAVLDVPDLDERDPPIFGRGLSIHDLSVLLPTPDDSGAGGQDGDLRIVYRTIGNCQISAGRLARITNHPAAGLLAAGHTKRRARDDLGHDMKLNDVVCVGFRRCRCSVKELVAMYRHRLNKTPLIDTVYFPRDFAILWFKHYKPQLAHQDFRTQPRFIFPLICRMSKISLVVVRPCHYLTVVDCLLEGSQQRI
jgi:hypothetical protein